MPNNWKKYKFSDFVDINPTIRFSKDELYSFVEMKDLNENNKFVLPSTEKGVTGGARFGENDTLFARITPCLQNGKICQVKGLKNNVGFGSTEFLVFRGKEGISDTNFVYYLSREEGVRKFAEQNMIGTSGRQRVVKDAFHNLVLELPPLPEQTAIAEILSALDDKIELNLQTNKTLEEMANALYKHWFVDFGPFQNGKFVESELGMIPEGWEVANLKSLIVDFNNKRGPISSMEREKIKGEYPYYGATGILDYVDKYALDGRYILVAEDGTVKNNTNNPYLQYVEGKFWVSNHAHIIKGNERYPDSFVYYTLSNTIVLPYITGAVQPKLSKGSLECIVIIKPTSEVAFKYSKIVDEYVDLIFETNYEIEKLKQTRDYLLPKLISGEIRVKDAAQKLKEVL